MNAGARAAPAVRLLLLLPLLAAAKSYYYPEISTDVILQPDGSARIVQERTYEFDGRFSWADLDLKKQGAADIWLNRMAMESGARWQDLSPEVVNTDQSLYLRWGYSAEDEQRTFLVDYTVTGAVRRYEDVAEFYWKVIEDEHERIGQVVVRVILPGRSPDLFKVYVHAAARPGTLSFAGTFDTAYIRQSGIPRNAFVEVRVLSSPELFPQTPPVAQKRYARILAEEKQNFLSASLKTYFFLPLGLFLLIPLPVILLIVFYRKHGREPELVYEAIYEHEPPRKAPPAAVPLILHQKPDKSSLIQPLFAGMMATLLDLGRHGAVVVQETKEGRRSRYSFRLARPELAEKAGELASKVTRFFFAQVASGRSEFDESDVKKYGQSRPSAVREFIADVFDTGMAWWRKTLGVDFVERASSKAYWTFLLLVLASAAAGGFSLVNGLSAIVYFEPPVRAIVTAVIAGLVFVLFSILGRTILRWTGTAYLEHRRWQNFRKFLKDFSAIEQAPVNLLAIWEEYYVYAVALGVASEFLKHVTRLAEQRGTNLLLPVWYIGATGVPGGSLASLSEGLAGFSSFASNMSSMMSSFSTASSSGGGFSGGGGGGGGGGSSGAG
ncbi:DUF2207 domain-containing protein [candidate division WOR-3 bacterium]|nr:DUF2207 domain-containing protein [candidate division WOR-3 bacterium]